MMKTSDGRISAVQISRTRGKAYQCSAMGFLMVFYEEFYRSSEGFH